MPFLSAMRLFSRVMASSVLQNDSKHSKYLLSYVRLTTRWGKPCGGIKPCVMESSRVEPDGSTVDANLQA